MNLLCYLLLHYCMNIVLLPYGLNDFDIDFGYATAAWPQCFDDDRVCMWPLLRTLLLLLMLLMLSRSSPVSRSLPAGTARWPRSCLASPGRRRHLSSRLIACLSESLCRLNERRLPPYSATALRPESMCFQLFPRVL